MAPCTSQSTSNSQLAKGGAAGVGDLAYINPAAAKADRAAATARV